MKILRCSVTPVAISLLIVVGTARSAHADPIAYSFSGVLGDCATPPLGTCINDLAGHTVQGQFTTDSALTTLLTASFSVVGGNFTWRTLLPDPAPNQLTSTVTPTSLFIDETLLLPFPEFERFILSLNFDNSLTGPAGSLLQSGYIERRGAVGIKNPFVSAAASVVPEPPSAWLLTTGVVILITLFGTRRRGDISLNRN